MQKKLALSSPTTSYAYLKKILNKNGIVLYNLFSNHLRISMNEDESLQFSRGILKEENVIWYDRDNTQHAIDQLRELNPDFILYGYEYDIANIDIISNAVCPHCSNPVSSSSCREDKSRTNYVLKCSGFRVPNKYIVSRDRIGFDSLKYPLVAKPNILSGGLNRLNIFYDQHQLANFMMEQNIETLDTEELVWDESNIDFQVSYSIDGYCINKEFYFISVQRWYKKFDAKGVRYFSAEQIDPNSEFSLNIFNEAKKRLIALEMFNGFFHPEFIFSDNQFILIDLNPRIAGGYGIVDKMIASSLGTGVIQSFINKVYFNKYTPNNFIQYSMLLFSFELKENDIFEISKLDSHVETIDGKHLNCQISLFSNKNLSQLQKDFFAASKL